MSGGLNWHSVNWSSERGVQNYSPFLVAKGVILLIYACIHLYLNEIYFLYDNVKVDFALKRYTSSFVYMRITPKKKRKTLCVYRNKGVVVFFFSFLHFRGAFPFKEV